MLYSDASGGFCFHRGCVCGALDDGGFHAVWRVREPKSETEMLVPQPTEGLASAELQMLVVPAPDGSAPAIVVLALNVVLAQPVLVAAVLVQDVVALHTSALHTFSATPPFLSEAFAALLRAAPTRLDLLARGLVKIQPELGAAPVQL